MSKMKNTRTMLLFLLVTMISLGVSAQNVTVKGTVKDKAGETVIGASVVQKGNTGNGTITDIDGNYSLNVPSNSTLIFSYVGMTTQEIAVKGQKTIDVILADDAQALEEVVVIGYGTAKKKDLTGSVATVNSEALTVVPVASATEALTGKMAGVQITTTEGSPDAEMKIRVRGGGSITGDNTPLFIVDGFPVESISDIPASDIEDMTVLKDASSTAIYGSRGANGVIIVTTKSGKEGKISVNYNAYYSWKKMAKQLNTLSSADYTKWQYELAALNSGNFDTINPEEYTKIFGNYEDMDLYNDVPANNWQDQIFGRTGHTFNHNLSITGGSDKTKYAFSYAHMDDKAIMIGSNFKRDNLSLKLNHKPNKRISLDFSVRYSNTTINGGGANESKNEVSSADSRMKDVMIYTPFNFKDLSDGYDPELQLTNPLISVADNDRIQKRQTFNYNGSFTWEIIENLKVKTEFGLDQYYSKDNRFYGVTTYKSRENGNEQPIVIFTGKDRKSFRNTNTLNYDFKKLLKNDKHHLSALVGQELIKVKSNVDTDEVRFYPASFNSHQAFNLSSQGTAFSTDKYTNADDILLSYFARANYDYEGKYLISATFRADGSSKFADGNRWGTFPSVSLGWNVMNEDFFENIKETMNELKIRASYGVLGNLSGIGNYATQSVVYKGMNNMMGTELWEGAITGKEWTSPMNVTWEKTKTLNLGLDFAFLNNKFSVSADYFIQKTEDMLLSMPQSLSFGLSGNPTVNAGTVENKGFEISLNHRNNVGDLYYHVGVNATFIKNELTEVNGSRDEWQGFNPHAKGTITYAKTGHSIGYFNLIKTDGVFQSQQEIDAYVDKNGNKIQPNAQPGDLRFVDYNGDGKIDNNDRQDVGSAFPKVNLGVSLGAEWKGLDLNMFFDGNFGNKIYNAQYYTTVYNESTGNQYAERMNSWTENNHSDIPRCLFGTSDPNGTNWGYTDRWLENGSFLRLKTLELGYTLPKVWVSKAGLQNVRVYTAMENLFTITDYKGYTPDLGMVDADGAGTSGGSGVMTRGCDDGRYPMARTITFGLQVNF